MFFERLIFYDFETAVTFKSHFEKFPFIKSQHFSVTVSF